MENMNSAVDSLDNPSTPPLEGTLVYHAPAKLNLGLRIFPRRPDGYHDIESWFVPISLRDTLTFCRADSLTLQLSGLAAGLSDDPEKNLVGRAAMILAGAAGIQPHVRINLHKIIPAGGGLGGGSSDAATTLLALKQFWNLPISLAELSGMAASLGSDVPFFIHGRSAVCRGRGEIIEPLPLHRLLFAVLIIPPYPTSTKDVYQAFDQQAVAAGTATIPWQELSQSNAAGISSVIRNDLEAPAFSVTAPLRSLRDEICGIADRPVHLSGSGSTLFILADQPAEAAALAENLAGRLPENIRTVPVRIGHA
jgi:4-diphosphocytidyl-2-C-methyl-D-erythritol kinase